MARAIGDTGASHAPTFGFAKDTDRPPIESFSLDITVAAVATGGLSHQGHDEPRRLRPAARRNDGGVSGHAEYRHDVFQCRGAGRLGRDHRPLPFFGSPVSFPLSLSLPHEKRAATHQFRQIAHLPRREQGEPSRIPRHRIRSTAGKPSSRDSAASGSITSWPRPVPNGAACGRPSHARRYPIRLARPI